MLVLALDTSTAAISAAVVEVGAHDVHTRSSREVVNPRGHGELLTPTIDAVLAEAGATARDLSAVVAGVGPGPYTGLRVGLVTAAALADALDIPAYGVCSLDGITGAPLVVTDARRKEVYWARYDADGERIEGPFVDRPDDVPNSEPANGAGARMYPEVFGEPPERHRVDYPDPGWLVVRARRRIVAGAPSEALTPLYLRHPDAVVPGAPKPVRQ
jgi:tRNA threonylcarbamoyl adenosine modification protein YeaZ